MIEDKTYTQALREALSRNETFSQSAPELLERYFLSGWEITNCEEIQPDLSQGVRSINERSLLARVEARATRDIDGYNHFGAYVKMPCGTQITLNFWLLEHARIYVDMWMKPHQISTAFSLHHNPTVTPGYKPGGWGELTSRPGVSQQGWIATYGRHMTPRKRSTKRRGVYQRRATG